MISKLEIIEGNKENMIIGLTGGIASGKSESVKYFKELGVYSIDADAISHELTVFGTSYFNKIVQVFGQNILFSNMLLNRKKLANIIFSDKNAKLIVEEILHGKIIMRINEIVSQKKSKYANIMINAPLLFEIGLDKICDKVIVIWASYETQRKRLAMRDGLNDEDVQKRIYSQMPVKEKIKLADFVINNNGSKKALKKCIYNFYKLCIT
ncbi:MAG: dephospho-CoA kinase [Endomicrobium sp.]|nr:dephospho-CoA kinase [Endomicrobium sp.]